MLLLIYLVGVAISVGYTTAEVTHRYVHDTFSSRFTSFMTVITISLLSWITVGAILHDIKRSN